jgi:hypothetical protein
VLTVRWVSTPVEAVTVDGLVPARMINEVLYCERLMYLEWVQGEWADNVYTGGGASRAPAGWMT